MSRPPAPSSQPDHCDPSAWTSEAPLLHVEAGRGRFANGKSASTNPTAPLGSGVDSSCGTGDSPSSRFSLARLSARIDAGAPPSRPTAPQPGSGSPTWGASASPPLGSNLNPTVGIHREHAARTAAGEAGVAVAKGDAEPPLRIALLTSEAVPFAKTGGLADVAGALPNALNRLGQRATVILPCHRSAWKAGVPIRATGITAQVPVGTALVNADFLEAVVPDRDPSHPGTRFILIDQPAFFDRRSLYGEHGSDYRDNAERFLFFTRAALAAIQELDLKPDLIHCNDWQTGLVPVHLREPLGSSWSQVACLLTIHNMAYQGSFPASDFRLTGLPPWLFDYRGVEAYGRFNFLKAGLVFADAISTVSPTYAREIQTPEFGCGLDGLLRHRAGDLFGIVNGIDPAQWNPAIDPHLAQTYDRDTVLEGKAVCKAFLQRRASLPERPEVPLFGAVGRLDPQKGWDLLARVLPNFLAHHDVQLVVLGEGQPRYHELLDHLASDHPHKVRAFLEFSNALAHQIEAGVDFFLMPSLYEPCGLNQLYSMIYGAVPIVRATGGLADTVIDATPDALAQDQATGLVFRDATPEALAHALERALDLFHQPHLLHRLIRSAMSRDWSWDRSARDYVALYRRLAYRRRASRTASATMLDPPSRLA